MRYFKVNSEWEAVSEFYQSIAAHIEKESIGFIRNEDIICMACVDKGLILLFDKMLGLTEIEQPKNVLDGGWMYYGNEQLFIQKL